MPEIQLPAGTIRYREHGTGAPVLFLHGLLVDGRLWDRTLPHLHGRRLIVPHWPLGSHRPALNASAELTPPGLAGEFADARLDWIEGARAFVPLDHPSAWPG